MNLSYLQTHSHFLFHSVSKILQYHWFEIGSVTSTINQSECEERERFGHYKFFLSFSYCSSYSYSNSCIMPCSSCRSL